MAFAVLYLPLIREFGASRAEVATVQALVLLLGGAAGPLVGFALDRLGARRLIQAGAGVAALSLIAASRAHSLAAVGILYGVVGGLGLAALGRKGPTGGMFREDGWGCSPRRPAGQRRARRIFSDWGSPRPRFC